MAALLRELFWPAAAGNVFWAFFTVVIKEPNWWASGCKLSKIFALLFIAIYLATDWLWTTKNRITTPSPRFWLVEYPFLIAIAAFAIATQEKTFPDEIKWSEIILGLAFVLAAIGHGTDLWTSTKHLSPPKLLKRLSDKFGFKSDLPSAYTRGVLVAINLLGVFILVVPRCSFDYSGCWHLPVAILLPFVCWMYVYWKANGGPEGRGMSFTFDCRLAKPADIAAITCLAKRLGSETEGRTLIEETVKEGIKELVTPTEKSNKTVTRIFVAVTAPPTNGTETIVGYLTISGAEWSDWDNGMFLWLGSSYVLPEYRMNDVAKSLYDMAVKHAKTIEAVGLKAYVLESNESAKAAHEKVGQKVTKYIVTENRFKQDALPA